MGTHVRLVAIPSSDVEFATHAEAALASIGGGADEATRQELERRLRRLYPGAEVRRRVELASYGPTDEPVWYAFNRAFSTPIRESVDLPARREDVFALYLARYPDWQSAVETRAIEPAPGAIASYEATYEIFGRRFDGRFDVMETDPPRSIRVEATGGSGIAVWYVTSFRDIPTGTRVEVVGDYELPSRLLPDVQRFIVDRVIARDIRRAHATLAELVDRELGGRTGRADEVGAGRQERSTSGRGA